MRGDLIEQLLSPACCVRREVLKPQDKQRRTLGILVSGRPHAVVHHVQPRVQAWKVWVDDTSPRARLVLCVGAREAKRAFIAVELLARTVRRHLLDHQFIKVGPAHALLQHIAALQLRVHVARRHTKNGEASQELPPPHRRRGRAPRFRRVPLRLILPNLVTLLALCSGLTAIRMALETRWDFAIGAIVLAAVLDALDGRVARLVKGTSKFGAELDSLADFVNFGVAPALILYSWLLLDLLFFYLKQMHQLLP